MSVYTVFLEMHKHVYQSWFLHLSKGHKVKNLTITLRICENVKADYQGYVWCLGGQQQINLLFFKICPDIQIGYVQITCHAKKSIL